MDCSKKKFAPKVVIIYKAFWILFCVNLLFLVFIFVSYQMNDNLNEKLEDALYGSWIEYKIYEHQQPWWILCIWMCKLIIVRFYLTFFNSFGFSPQTKLCSLRFPNTLVDWEQSCIHLVLVWVISHHIQDWNK